MTRPTTQDRREMARDLATRWRTRVAKTVVSLALAAGLSQPLAAQETVTLGIARLFSNDLIGDGHDRWHSGGYAVSLLRGPAWGGTLPATPGTVLEYRLRTEVIAPAARLGRPGYRPYVGTLGAGLHTAFAIGPAEARLGVDVVAIGPQTGVSDFQDGFHRMFGLDRPRGIDRQLGNAVHVGAVAELAWPMRLSDRVTVRPFAEGLAGIETLARVGADVIVGGVMHDDLVTRDVTTGHLMRATRGAARGVSLVAGADVARVRDSVYLPAARGIAPEATRWRARGGVHWQVGPGMSVFYGATYLSGDYVGQPEGQVLGSLTLDFAF